MTRSYQASALAPASEMPYAVLVGLNTAPAQLKVNKIVSDPAWWCRVSTLPSVMAKGFLGQTIGPGTSSSRHFRERNASAWSS